MGRQKGAVDPDLCSTDAARRRWWRGVLLVVARNGGEMVFVDSLWRKSRGRLCRLGIEEGRLGRPVGPDWPGWGGGRGIEGSQGGVGRWQEMLAARAPGDGGGEPDMEGSSSR